MAQEKREKDKIAAKEKAAAEAKIKAAEDAKKKEEDKLDALQKMIIEHNKQQLEREKKQLAKFEAEQKAKDAAAAAAAAAKKAADEKAAELAAAAGKAKSEAEAAAAAKAAEEKAAYEKKAAEEKAAFDKATAEEKAAHDKAIEEATKKAAELEAAKKKAEDEAASLRPGDDMTKPPIKFKDAVGRKFSFPWHLCKTWKVKLSSIQLVEDQGLTSHREWNRLSSKPSYMSMSLANTCTKVITTSSVLMARSFFHKCTSPWLNQIGLSPCTCGRCLSLQRNPLLLLLPTCLLLGWEWVHLPWQCRPLCISRTRTRKGAKCRPRLPR